MQKKTKIFNTCDLKSSEKEINAIYILHRRSHPAMYHQSNFNLMITCQGLAVYKPNFTGIYLLSQEHIT